MLLLLVRLLARPVELGVLLVVHPPVVDLVPALKHALMEYAQPLPPNHAEEAAQELDKHATLQPILAPACLDTSSVSLAFAL